MSSDDVEQLGLSHDSVPVSKYSASISSQPSTRTYEDNAVNRRLGRVGLPVSETSRPPSSSEKTYVDNAQNRFLGRVGLPVGLLETNLDAGEGYFEGLFLKFQKVPILPEFPRYCFHFIKLKK